MGYSVSVKFKNEYEKERMKSFLMENQEILENLEKVEIMGRINTNEPSDGENLGYAPKQKFLLGFYGTGIPRYIWDLCSWMAVKANAKKGNDYFFYYDSEKMVVTKDLNNKLNTIVDDRGIRIVNVDEEFSYLKKAIDLFSGRKKSIEKQNEFFEQLESKWNDFVLNYDNAKLNLNKNKKKSP